MVDRSLSRAATELAAALLAASAPALAQDPLFLFGGSLPQDAPIVTVEVVPGDFDADGDLDLYMAKRGQDRVLQNDGSGNFVDVTASSGIPIVSTESRGAAGGDLDGDGDIDIYVANWLGRHYLLLNDGAGSFTESGVGRLPSVDTRAPKHVLLADIEADGDLDVLLAIDVLVVLLVNDGTAHFVDASATHLPAAANALPCFAFGDVDGDGDGDLMLGNKDTQNRLYLNDGTGHFSDATATSMPVDSARTNSIVLADVDGDGDLDAVLANQNSQQDRLYLNDGLGIFHDATAARLPADTLATEVVLAHDFDADGDIDLYLGMSLYRQDRYYRNDGFGFFSDATATEMPVDADWNYTSATGDFDGDGRMDIAAANYNSPHRLYLNQLAIATVSPYGVGCAGTVGIPTISTSGSPALPVMGNASFAIELASARPHSLAVLLFGATAGQTPGGCTSWLATDWIFPWSSFTNATGSARVPAAVPGDPLLRGLQLELQWAILDPFGGFGGLATSGGLHLELGD
ncbi:MAG: VCBS repeat-containing protein [Planctomycetes bacterium]|nr:VCBS repeat-containing protein [Planctomycetota bacterium]